jgi:rare lipoprotein A
LPPRTGAENPVATVTLPRTLRPALLLPGALLAACAPAQWERPAQAPVVVAPAPAPVQPAPAPAATPPAAPAVPAPVWSAPPTAAASPPPALSRYGNPLFYSVFGVRYHVLRSSAGYSARGIASWYGKDFHGKRTSSGVPYDMHAMTAAHKTLPLPTTVRVTNLQNGRSVVVTVNDRGPFVAGRVIDLSYAAAKELDMIQGGTASVEVETVTNLAGTGAGAGPLISQGDLATGSVSALNAQGGSLPARQAYLQVGAFSDQVNAERLRALLSDAGVNDVVIRYDAAAGRGLYRVRIGPLTSASEFDTLASRVRSLGVTSTPQLVTEAQGMN